MLDVLTRHRRRGEPARHRAGPAAGFFAGALTRLENCARPAGLLDRRRRGHRLMLNRGRRAARVPRRESMLLIACIVAVAAPARRRRWRGRGGGRRRDDHSGVPPRRRTSAPPAASPRFKAKCCCGCRRRRRDGADARSSHSERRRFCAVLRGQLTEEQASSEDRRAAQDPPRTWPILQLGEGWTRRRGSITFARDYSFAGSVERIKDDDLADEVAAIERRGDVSAEDGRALRARGRRRATPSDPSAARPGAAVLHHCGQPPSRS